jgi:multidrug resistance protein
MFPKTTPIEEKKRMIALPKGKASMFKRIEPGNEGIASVLALALIPLSGLATDIYLPSLPAMARAMHVGPLQIQFTITLYLLSYGISQLFLGSVLDSYGRHRIGMAALLVFALASLVIAMTHNIFVVYAMRIVHGIAVGAVLAGKRAFFVDVYTGDKLKNYLSLLSIIWSTGPIVAPFIGGWLQTAFGWQANFYTLALFAVAFFILEFVFSGETLAQARPFDLKKIIPVYGGMLRYAPFVLGIVMMGLAGGIIMVYNMTGPFIIEHRMGMSPVVAGYCSLVMGLAWMTGGFVAKSTLQLSFLRKQAVNIGLQISFALAMLASLTGVDNIYSLVAFAFLVHACAGYTFNNFSIFCLTRFPQNAGIASGLTGGIAFVIISTSSYGMVNIFPARDAHNLGYSYLCLALLSAVVVALGGKLRAASSELRAASF